MMLEKPQEIMKEAEDGYASIKLKLNVIKTQYSIFCFIAEKPVTKLR